MKYSFKTGGPWLKNDIKLLGNTEYEEKVQLLNLVLRLSCRMDKKDIILFCRMILLDCEDTETAETNDARFEQVYLQPKCS